VVVVEVESTSCKYWRTRENIESSQKSAKLSRRHVYVSIIGKCHKQHLKSTDLVIVVELESRVELCWIKFNTIQHVLNSVLNHDWIFLEFNRTQHMEFSFTMSHRGLWILNSTQYAIVHKIQIQYECKIFSTMYWITCWIRVELRLKIQHRVELCWINSTRDLVHKCPHFRTASVGNKCFTIYYASLAWQFCAFSRGFNVLPCPPIWSCSAVRSISNLKIIVHWSSYPISTSYRERERERVVVVVVVVVISDSSSNKKTQLNNTLIWITKRRIHTIYDTCRALASCASRHAFQAMVRTAIRKQKLIHNATNQRSSSSISASSSSSSSSSPPSS